MKEKILIIEDETDIAEIIDMYLSKEGYVTTKCFSGLKAKEIIDKSEFDVAILDIMLPELSGLELCQYIRSKYNYPIIMLTAKTGEIDKITGLSMGADDYITKPFLPLELVARVKAQLRRYKCYNESKSDNTVICHKGLVINKNTYECYLNEKELKLTPTEFMILAILCENAGRVFSSEEIFKRLWKDEVYEKNNNTITVHIRHIRKKMDDSFENPKYIKTVWGVGYKIEKYI